MRPPRYRKPDVLARIPRDAHAVIEASAGTGKTFTLEHLVVDLVIEGRATIDQILVVTFTEKGRLELKARLRRMLARLVDWTDADAGGAPDADCWILDGERRARLVQALRGFESATVATIHSFCQRILVEHAFAGKRLLRQEQADGARVLARAYLDALREEPARREAVRAALAAAVGAGCDFDAIREHLGRALRHRGPVVAVPAPDDALRRLRALPAALLAPGELARRAAALDLHAQTRKSVINHGDVVLAAARDGLARGGDLAWRLELAGLAKAAEYFDARRDQLAGQGATLDELLAALDALGRAAVTPLGACVHELCEPVRDRIARAKRDAGEFDFDDMLALVRDALVGAGGPALQASLRARYRYALIDEFQDTDEVQWEIFRELFFAGAGANVLYLVGDPKQAIYGFRGADVHTYVRARAEVGGAPVVLADNFRSSADMIAACNEILDQAADEPFFAGEAIRYDRPVRCGDPTIRAEDADGRPAPPVHLLVGGDTAALHAFVAREIRALLDPARPALTWHKGGEPRTLRARDIFVLTNKGAEGVAIGQVLRAQGVPFAFFKQDGLFQGREARDVADLLAAVDDPRDRSRRMRAWLTPFFSVPLGALRACRDLPGDHPLAARLDDWHRLAAARRYERLFAQIVEQSGLVRAELLCKRSERELTNYLHIFELLLEEAQAARPPLAELVGRLRSFVAGSGRPVGEDTQTQRLESELDAVQIMTMHKAKGLEAPVVFLIGTGSNFRDGWLRYHDGDQVVLELGHALTRPATLARAAEEELRENERLLYVAMTRAMVRLYLPCAPLPVKEGASAEERAAQRRKERGKTRYGTLDVRLDAMRARGLGPRFRLRDLAAEAVAAPAPARAPGALAAWSPPSPEPAGARADFAGWRERAYGFVVTSYSALHRAHLAAGDDGDTMDLLGAPGGDRAAATGAGLPAGIATGLALHEILERAPFADVRADADAWAKDGRARVLAERCLLANGLDRRHAGEALAIAHRALTVPVPLGVGRTLAGFASLASAERELAFFLPLGAGPPVGAAAVADGIRLEQGYLSGVMDLVFEHEGLVYFADWKSDVVEGGAAAVEALVHERYRLQARIYSLAVARMLGLRDATDHERRFGGMLYVFLRELRADRPGSGLCFARPSWAELARYEDALAGEVHGLRRRRIEEWGR